MQKLLRPRFTFANVISFIALFVALGSGAYAATQLPKNSVGSRQLKNDAVISSKVKDGSLLATDFLSGQLPAGPQGPKGDRGEKGPQGVQGQTGPTGPTGPSGATHVITRRATVANIPNADPESSRTVLCAAGEKVVGGGGSFVDLDEHPVQPAKLQVSVPVKADGTLAPADAEAVGWRVSAINESGQPAGFIVFALCATP